jgi:hypothetical protein
VGHLYKSEITQDFSRPFFRRRFQKVDMKKVFDYAVLVAPPSVMTVRESRRYRSRIISDVPFGVGDCVARSLESRVLFNEVKISPERFVEEKEP